MSRQNKLLYLLSAASILFGIVLFNPLPLFFQNDDFIHIPLTEKGMWLQQGSFRPVSEISMKLDVFLWGKTASGYHLTNLLLHIFCSALIFLFLKELFKNLLYVKQYRLIAFMATALFFVYAMHSEAVFWILARASILSTIFSVLFLYSYLKINQSNFYYLTCLLSFWLALLCYESAWMLLIYAVLISINRSKKTGTVKPERQFIAILILSFLVYLSARFYFTGSFLGDYLTNGLGEADPLLLVRNLSILITRSVIPPLSTGMIIILGFVVTGVISFVLFININREEKKKIFFLFLIFLMSLLPFVGLGVDSHGTESERFLYFPSIFVCCILTRLIMASSVKQTSRAAFFSIFIVFHLLALSSAARNYREAGVVVRQTLTEIQNLKDGTKLEVISLPQNQKGAHIFRVGFLEMADWYGKNIDITITSNKFELIPLKTPLIVKYTMPDEIFEKFNQIKGNNQKHFLYTDSLLFIY